MISWSNGKRVYPAYAQARVINTASAVAQENAVVVFPAGTQRKDGKSLAEQHRTGVFLINVFDVLNVAESAEITAKAVGVISLQHDLILHIPAAGAAQVTLKRDFIFVSDFFYGLFHSVPPCGKCAAALRLRHISKAQAARPVMCEFAALCGVGSINSV